MAAASQRSAVRDQKSASEPATSDLATSDLRPPTSDLRRLRGRVILFTSTLNMDWTTWPVLPSYAALMQEVLHYAIAGRLREQATTVGEPLEEMLSTPSSGLKVTMHVPWQEDPEKTQTQANGDGSVLRWPDTSISGIYRATIGEQPVEHLFAVNVPTATDTQQATESDLTRTNDVELRDAYQWDFQLVTDPRQAEHFAVPLKEQDILIGRKLTLGPLGPEIARWLLLVMFALILAEVVLAWSFGHFSTVADTQSDRPARGVLLPLLTLCCTGLIIVTVTAVLIHAPRTGDFLGFLPDATRRSMETGAYAPDPLCRVIDACDPGIFPKGFRYWIALAPDLPVLESGESRVWRLEFLHYFVSAAADPWLAGVLALATAALVFTIHQLEGRTASIVYKLLLSTLLSCFVLFALSVLLPRLQVHFKRKAGPTSPSFSTTRRA